MIRFIFLATLFSTLNIVHAQGTATSAINSDKRDSSHFAKERELIPGETMGQKIESLLFWSVAEKKKRFPHMHQIFPSVEVQAGDKTSTLLLASTIQDEIGEEQYVDSYMKKNNIAGLMVLKGNEIRLEKYADDVERNTVWTSFSVGKSVTSMLLGVALKEGDVESLDDPLSKYISELDGTDYGEVSVRQLLTMTSGIEWNEDYADHESDVAQMYLQPCKAEEPHILTYMKPLKSIHEAGKKFNYSTGETDLLGILIQEATGKSLAEYLSEKIWKPYGMEHNAFWLADECSMMNLGGSGLSATLRDYSRLGKLMLDQEKHAFFADEWRENATSLLLPVSEDGGGYGYLWWRFPNGSYAAVGIFGQMIYINPETDVVIAQFAAWPKAGSAELSAERAGFIKAVEKALQE